MGKKHASQYANFGSLQIFFYYFMNYDITYFYLEFVIYISFSSDVELLRKS